MCVLRPYPEIRPFDHRSTALLLRNYSLKRPVIRSGQQPKEDVEAVMADGEEPLPDIENEDRKDGGSEPHGRDSDTKDVEEISEKV